MSQITPQCHNKPFQQMTEKELREELAYWEQKVSEASGWGNALGAAQEFCSDIKRILRTREENASK